MSFYSIADFIKDYYPEYWGHVEYDAEKCAVIHKVKDEWGIFCNFAKTPLKVNDWSSTMKYPELSLSLFLNSSH